MHWRLSNQGAGQQEVMQKKYGKFIGSYETAMGLQSTQLMHQLYFEEMEKETTSSQDILSFPILPSFQPHSCNLFFAVPTYASPSTYYLQLRLKNISEDSADWAGDRRLMQVILDRDQSPNHLKLARTALLDILNVIKDKTYKGYTRNYDNCCLKICNGILHLLIGENVSQVEQQRILSQVGAVDDLTQLMRRMRDRSVISAIAVDAHPLEYFQEGLQLIHPAIWAIYTLLLEQQKKMHPHSSYPHLCPIYDDDAIEDGYHSKIVFINLDRDQGEQDLTLATHLANHLLYISFPEFIDRQKQERFFETVFDPQFYDKCGNIHIFPTRMNNLFDCKSDITDASKWRSHFIDYIFDSFLLQRIGSFNPSFVVVNYSSNSYLHDRYFDKLMSRLIARVGERVLMYCNTTSKEEDYQEGEEENESGHFQFSNQFLKSQGTTRQTVNSHMNSHMNNAILFRSVSRHRDTLSKVKQFVSLVCPIIGASRDCFSQTVADQYIYSRIYPHLSNISSILGSVFPAIQDLFNDISYQMRTEEFNQALLKHGGNLEACVPAFYQSLFIQLAKEAKNVEFIVKETIRLASRQYDEGLTLIVKGLDTITARLNGIKQIYAESQIIYNSTPQGPELRVFIMNHFAQKDVKNYMTLIPLENKSKAAIPQQLIGIHPIVTDFVVRQAWHFRQTASNVVLFWPTHFDHKKASLCEMSGTQYIPQVSGEVYVGEKNQSQFYEIPELGITPQLECIAYSINDNLFIFESGVVHELRQQFGEWVVDTVEHQQSLDYVNMQLVETTTQNIYLVGSDELVQMSYYEINFRNSSFSRITKHFNDIPILMNNQEHLLAKEKSLAGELHGETDRIKYCVQYWVQYGLMRSKIERVTGVKTSHQKNYRGFGEAVGDIVAEEVEEKLELELVDECRNYVKATYKGETYLLTLSYNGRTLLNENVGSLAVEGDRLYALIYHALYTNGAYVLAECKECTARQIVDETLSLSPIYTSQQNLEGSKVVICKINEVAILSGVVHFPNREDYFVKTNNGVSQIFAIPSIQGREEGPIYSWMFSQEAMLYTFALQETNRGYIVHSYEMSLCKTDRKWRQKHADRLLQMEIGRVREARLVSMEAVELGVQVRQKLYTGSLLLGGKGESQTTLALREGKEDGYPLLPMVEREAHD